MAWPKGKPRPPNSGRKKGSPNKLTEVKNCFLQVFHERGKEGLSEWAEKDPSGFYRTMASLLPKEVEAKVEGTLEIKWQS